MDLTILTISSLCRGQCAVVLKNQKNYHLNVAWCWFSFSVMIKIVHTVSPGSPFSPALPCNWTEIALIIINPPQAVFENWNLNPIPMVRRLPSLQTLLSRPSCPFHLWTLDPPARAQTHLSCRSQFVICVRLSVVLILCVCVFTLSPCKPCPGRPLGPEIPWKPGSPWKHRLCQLGTIEVIEMLYLVANKGSVKDFLISSCGRQASTFGPWFPSPGNPGGPGAPVLPTEPCKHIKVYFCGC